ncbi:hypothetical protein NDU88_005820 [Pleurodeles waltl]|uniref:Uncharacterized protein n=1 Tax=Pleurodeles waltl TaxID=8319 RepID=A0AAV7QGV8_PLEWA|nr:hypothetical protein NDU88_005820 [Pleurodeles waltl]
MIHPSIPAWKLCLDSLEDLVFQDTIGMIIMQYFKDNMGTFKVVLREQCISKSVGIRKTILNEVLNSEETLHTWEQRRPGHPEVQPDPLEAKVMVAECIERLQCFDYQEYMVQAYAEVDCAAFLLALLVNPAKRGSVIVEVDTELGTKAYHQENINYEFQDYYTALHSSAGRTSSADIEDFLVPLALLRVSPEGAAFHSSAGRTSSADFEDFLVPLGLLRVSPEGAEDLGGNINLQWV